MRLALAAVCVLALCACTYSVSRVPPPPEFERPLAEVLREYADVAPIFPDASPDGRFGMARADALVAARGAPASRKLSWWSLWPGNWPFVPQYLWTWQLGPRAVTCRIDHPF